MLRVAKLWNVAEGPANSSINLFAVGMLTLLRTEAYNAWDYNSIDQSQNETNNFIVMKYQRMYN
jgi:hypothetical protein